MSVVLPSCASTIAPDALVCGTTFDMLVTRGNGDVAANEASSEAMTVGARIDVVMSSA